jgi:hypothetical protein
MGEVSRQQALAQAANTKQQLQANFYGGACALTEGRLEDARDACDKYLALLSNPEWPECYEFLLEFEHFSRAGPQAPTGASKPQSAKAKPWWRFW